MILPFVFLSLSTSRAIVAPAPEYPQGIGALPDYLKSIVWLIVGSDGIPQHVEIACPSAGREFDEQAITSVRQWKFAPGIKEGRPIPVEIRVEVAWDSIEGRTKAKAEAEARTKERKKAKAFSEAFSLLAIDRFCPR